MGHPARSFGRAVVGAVFFPVAVFVAGIQVFYWSTSFGPRAVQSYLLLLVAFALGIWLISRPAYRSKRAKIVSIAMYSVIILPVLLYSGLMTACGNGDCL